MNFVNLKVYTFKCLNRLWQNVHLTSEFERSVNIEIFKGSIRCWSNFLQNIASHNNIPKVFVEKKNTKNDDKRN